MFTATSQLIMITNAVKLKGDLAGSVFVGFCAPTVIMV